MNVNDWKKIKVGDTLTHLKKTHSNLGYHYGKQYKVVEVNPLSRSVKIQSDDHAYSWDGAHGHDYWNFFKVSKGKPSWM